MFDNPGTVLAVLSIAGLLISALIFVIDSRINRMYRELKPNGGSSLRDAVDRQAVALDRIEQKIDSHIVWHLEDDK